MAAASSSALALAAHSSSVEHSGDGAKSDSSDKVRELLRHLKKRKEVAAKRRELLMKFMGVTQPKTYRRLLRTKYEVMAEEKAKKDKAPVVLNLPVKKAILEGDIIDTSGQNKVQQVDDEEGPLEEREYEGTTTFLKGTQSANPHNDYSQHFIDTGERPQNHIRDAGLAHRFEEYPKLRELIRLKDNLVSSTATPPMYLQCDPGSFDLVDGLGTLFEVVLVEPPLEEYRKTGMVFDKYWSWDEIEALPIEKITAVRSFCWIWCGNGEGLDRARDCLRKWGFRRSEDIIWIKTNREAKGAAGNYAMDSSAVFQRTKEHCLMGIKGTVRRSLDGDFIHANVDIDLILGEEPEWGCKEKPIEIFHLMEHFCLSRRRLHIFGRDSTIRPGWVTIGPELTSSNFDAEQYRSFFSPKAGGHILNAGDDIERLRPKSPPPRAGNMPPPTIMELQENPPGGAYRPGGGGFRPAPPPESRYRSAPDRYRPER